MWFLSWHSFLITCCLSLSYNSTFKTRPQRLRRRSARLCDMFFTLVSNSLKVIVSQAGLFRYMKTQPSLAGLRRPAVWKMDGQTSGVKYNRTSHYSVTPLHTVITVIDKTVLLVCWTWFHFTDVSLLVQGEAIHATGYCALQTGFWNSRDTLSQYLRFKST